jgi:hypothetical protein
MSIRPIASQKQEVNPPLVKRPQNNDWTAFGAQNLLDNPGHFSKDFSPENFCVIDEAGLFDFRVNNSTNTTNLSY